MRIIELPLALCPGGNPALTVLLERSNPMSVGYDVHFSVGYGLYGEIPPVSYDLLASHNRFSQHGYLVSDYPETTKAIDLEYGLVVRLDGPDNTIDPQSAAQGLADELLVFIGSEILSVVAVALVAAKTYRLYVARGRMFSNKANHLGGDEVYIVPKSDIAAIQHPAIFPGHEVSLKIVERVGRRPQALADIEPIAHTVANRILTETGITNLRFNGSRKYLNYAGGDVRFDWTTTDAGASLARPDLATVTTRVDFLTMVSGCLYSGSWIAGYYIHGTYNVAANFLELTGAELTTMVGANDFYVAARRQVATPDFTALSDPALLFITQ